MSRTMDDPGDLTILRACFYGLILRHRGYAPDEAALLVIERYPRVRRLLADFAAESEREERARAAGGAG